MGKPFLLGTLLLAIALAGTIGYRIGQRHGTAADGPAATDRTPERRLRRAAPSPGPAAPMDEELGRQVARAQHEPAYLQQLMARYRSEAEPDRKGAVLAILQGIANADVQRFALDLAASTDPAMRRDGLTLLSAYSMEEAPVRDMVVQELGQEQDPALLKQAVDLLAPTPLPSEDVAPILDRLERLREHPDPGVRAASVLQSAQWDKGGGAEDVLQRALLDPEAQVREAAIAGVTSSSVRSDRIKDALLDIASNPQSGNDERTAAVFALQGFSFNRAEYDLYRAAVEAMPDDGAH